MRRIGAAVLFGLAVGVPFAWFSVRFFVVRPAEVSSLEEYFASAPPGRVTQALVLLALSALIGAALVSLATWRVGVDGASLFAPWSAERILKWLAVCLPFGAALAVVPAAALEAGRDGASPPVSADGGTGDVWLAVLGIAALAAVALFLLDALGGLVRRR